MKTLGIILTIILCFGLAFGCACFEAWLISLLWNWLAPSLFGWGTLTFWQAFGLSILIDLLLGGFAKVTVRVRG
jgi:hypothetical protein